MGKVTTGTIKSVLSKKFGVKTTEFKRLSKKRFSSGRISRVFQYGEKKVEVVSDDQDEVVVGINEIGESDEDQPERGIQEEYSPDQLLISYAGADYSAEISEGAVFYICPKKYFELTGFLYDQHFEIKSNPRFNGFNVMEGVFEFEEKDSAKVEARLLKMGFKKSKKFDKFMKDSG